MAHDIVNNDDLSYKENYYYDIHLNRMDSNIKEFVNSYISVISGDFNRARDFWDKNMEPTDLMKFSDSFDLLEITIKDKSLKYGGNIINRYSIGYGGSSYGNYDRFETVYLNVTYRDYSSKAYNNQRTASIYLKIGVRDGELKIVDSTLPLAYLPDAKRKDGMKSKNEMSYDLNRWGYSSFEEELSIDNLESYKNSDDYFQDSETKNF